MTDVYDQHEKAFGKVGAYAILKGGEVVGKITIKFPADGAGRLYAFVHFLGTEMARGSATGYGYDKRTAAVAAAAAKLPNDVAVWQSTPEEAAAILAALRADAGAHFDSAIRNVPGFSVVQVL